MYKELGKTIKVGVIGIRSRGRSIIRTLLEIKGVEVAAICDLSDSRLKETSDEMKSMGAKEPECYKDYIKLLERDDIRAVVVSTPWILHIEIAIAAMKRGKYPCIEVGGAASTKECWDLVKASEDTGIPCTIFGNSIYGRKKMALLNMAKKEAFGELIHCQCGYMHDFRRSLTMGLEEGRGRIYHYLNKNGDNYPIHGIGLMAKSLNINRGNRFLSLVSMASKSRGLNEWAKNNFGEEHPFATKKFTQGDIITTMIKCAHGETVLLTLDTTLPRPQSGGLKFQGTKAIYSGENDSVYFDGKSPEHTWEPFDKYMEEYEHPLWKEYLKFGVRGGHLGSDYLVLRGFIESVANNTLAPIDVYDTATWLAITTLSEDSIALGSSPVPFPDFTNGKWINREPVVKSKFALDRVFDDLF
jgi:predicted dehydrogenase